MSTVVYSWNHRADLNGRPSSRQISGVFPSEKVSQLTLSTLRKEGVDRDRISRIVEKNPFPVFVISNVQRLEYANEASMPVLLYYDLEVGDVIPETWSAYIDEIQKTGGAVEEVIETNGMVFHLLFAPSEDESVTVYGREITRERQLESDLITAERGRTAAAMIATTGHEVMNPLTVAVGSIQRVLKKNQDPEITPHAQKCKDALGRISSVIREIRRLSEDSKIQFGEYEGDTEMLEIHPKKKKIS